MRHIHGHIVLQIYNCKSVINAPCQRGVYDVDDSENRKVHEVIVVKGSIRVIIAKTPVQIIQLQYNWQGGRGGSRKKSLFN